MCHAEMQGIEFVWISFVMASSRLKEDAVFLDLNWWLKRLLYH